jgi:hypothetical protein
VTLLKSGDRIKLTKPYTKLLFELTMGEQGVVLDIDAGSEKYVLQFRDHVTVRMTQDEADEYLAKVLTGLEVPRVLKEWYRQTAKYLGTNKVRVDE